MLFFFKWYVCLSKQVDTGKCEGLDFGDLSSGSWKTLPLKLFNRTRATVPIRLIISAVSDKSKGLLICLNIYAKLRICTDFYRYVAANPRTMLSNVSSLPLKGKQSFCLNICFLDWFGCQSCKSWIACHVWFMVMMTNDWYRLSHSKASHFVVCWSFTFPCAYIRYDYIGTCQDVRSLILHPVYVYLNIIRMPF